MKTFIFALWSQNHGRNEEGADSQHKLYKIEAESITEAVKKVLNENPWSGEDDKWKDIDPEYEESMEWYRNQIAELVTFEDIQAYFRRELIFMTNYLEL